MSGQIEAELLKIRSTRTTIGLALGMIALIVLFALLSGLLTKAPHLMSTQDQLGLLTVGFTGSGGNEMREYCDHILRVPCQETAVTQQIHIIAAHAICGVVERELFGRSGA